MMLADRSVTKRGDFSRVAGNMADEALVTACIHSFIHAFILARCILGSC
jgi:hypothetical protein